MRPHDNPFEHLAGLDEPEFSARLLFYLLSRGDDFRDALLERIYTEAELPGDAPKEATLFLNGQRARRVHSDNVAPLGLFVRRSGFSASLGITCICAEPFSSVRSFPVAIGDRHLITVLIAPSWRVQAARRYFTQAGGPRVVCMHYYELRWILQQTLGKLRLAELPLLCSNYMSRRNIVFTGNQLPHWLSHTLEQHGTPAHWSLLQKLRGCFVEPDRELTVSRRFLGFSFKQGSARGWLSFHEAHGLFPSGRSVALILTLPHRIRPAHPRLLKVDRLEPPLPEKSGTEWRHWEVAYSVDWETFESWVGCFSSIVT